jgi:sarcosine oxidase subunit alpha
VTTKDITYSVEEGYDSIELSKRYTTLTMGPCQGRMCQLASIRKMAEDTGTPVAEVGLTTARPPWSTCDGRPAGRPFEPARPAVHGRHRDLGQRAWETPLPMTTGSRGDDGVHEGAG